MCRCITVLQSTAVQSTKGNTCEFKCMPPSSSRYDMYPQDCAKCLNQLTGAGVSRSTSVFTTSAQMTHMIPMHWGYLAHHTHTHTYQHNRALRSTKLGLMKRKPSGMPCKARRIMAMSLNQAL